MNERLWVFDFDGTISSLVPDRDAAVLHPSCELMILGLIRSESEIVAIVSSRTIGDLAARIPFRGLLLGGNSGVEWITREGRRIGPSAGSLKQLNRAKAKLDPGIASMAGLPGVEVEDKLWSIAVHYRRAEAPVRTRVERAVSNLAATCGIRLFRGPGAFEMSLIRSATKQRAVRRLCRYLGRVHPSRVIYAGDDENDADAMKWVIAEGGTAVTVGNRVQVDGAISAATPSRLSEVIDTIRKLSQATGSITQMGRQG